MTFPGLGGQQPPPQNSAPAGQLVPGVQPGVSGPIVRARQVIVSGAGEGVFVYNGTPAAGNLIASVAGAAATDPFGNAYLPGSTTYINGGQGTYFAMSMQGGFLECYYASGYAGPWSEAGGIIFSTAGALTFNFPYLQLGTAASADIPAAPPSITSLGSTWNATTASECNANFAAITTLLNEIGLTT